MFFIISTKDRSLELRGYGSLGFAVVNARFWGVSGVDTPLTPQNLETSPPIPKEPMVEVRR